MPKLHLDFETFSEAPLKKCGLYAYAEHDSTDIICAAYAWDDGPVHLWVPHALPQYIYEKVAARIEEGGHFHMKNECPPDLAAHILAKKPTAAHNHSFERKTSHSKAAARYKFPRIEIEGAICTAAKVAAAGLPRSLEDSAAALGAAQQKDTTAQNDLRYICKPLKDGSRATIKTDPDRFANVYIYCMQDVRTERAIDEMVPDLTEQETLVYALDQLANDRGILVDKESVDNVQFLIDEYKRYLAKKCMEWTGLAPTQTAKLANWCREHGYPRLLDMQVGTILAAVADPDCPKQVQKVLKLYSTNNMKAVSKYTSMRTAWCSDFRVRGMFLYYGAGTGRWSSMIIQLQNLYRSKITDANTAIEAFRDRDLDFIRFLYDIDPMKVFASCVRGMLIAKPDHEIMALDFSGIEARYNAWVAGEDWKLEAFRKYDTIIPGKFDKKGKPLRAGPDLYILAYCRAFGVDPSKVGDFERQVGKVMELALGYEGGVGAFVTMVGTYGIDLRDLADKAWDTIPSDILDEAYKMLEWARKKGKTMDLDERVYIVCESLKRLWRRAHPRIVQSWANYREASMLAVKNPGKVYATPNKKVMFKVVRIGANDWLQMRLPSGRKLWYFKPEVHGDVDEKALAKLKALEYEEGIPITQAMMDAITSNQHLTYMGIDTRTRRYARTSTYGGRWCENVCQAGSRDFIAGGMLHLEDEGYPIIGSVHDEALCEVHKEHGSLEHARKVICRLPDYAKDFPLTAEGFRAKRYRK